MGLLLLLLTYSASAAPSVSATAVSASAVSATAVSASAVSSSAVKAPAVKAPAVRALTVNTSVVDGNTSSQANTRLNLAIIAGTAIAAVVLVIIFYVIARRCGATNEQILESCGKPFFKLTTACCELLQNTE